VNQTVFGLAASVYANAYIYRRPHFFVWLAISVQAKTVWTALIFLLPLRHPIRTARTDGQMSDRLKLIGESLGAGVYPRVGFGGVLIPGCAPTSTQAKENENATERHEARREGQARAPAASGASGTSDQTAPLLRDGFDRWLVAEAKTLTRSFPETELIPAPDGAVITVKSRVLLEYPESVFFLTMLSPLYGQPRSWGFSVGPVFEPTWIGPRHTNYFDGSICAYEPTDGTWSLGMPLVDLFAYYTLWAARHLHLRQFGYWPGQQRVHRASERLAELKQNELCGCSDGTRPYRECCYGPDLEEQSVARALSHEIFITRRPPIDVVNYARGNGPPPRVSSVFASPPRWSAA
jgi:hypothetical protein